MSDKDEPIVKKCSAIEKKKCGEYTKIPLFPDLVGFGMHCVGNDTVALPSKQTFDIAGAMAAGSEKGQKAHCQSK